MDITAAQEQIDTYFDTESNSHALVRLVDDMFVLIDGEVTTIDLQAILSIMNKVD